MKKILSGAAIGLFILSMLPLDASAFYLWRYREDATDCTALTDGKVTDLCYEVDADTFYKCEPTAGDCSGAEWKPLNTTGNSATSTALAANGGNCSAGEYPLGVNASGAVESCTDATTEIAAYAQPLEATLTDIADGTIAEDLVNTANPWADNEVSDTITVGASGSVNDAAIPSGITRDTEWDTEGEVQTAWGSVNILLETEIDASSELLALMDDETGTGLLTFATNPLFTGARFGNGATTAGFLDLVEDTDNGTNRIRFTAPSAITSDQECILENDGNPIPDSCVGDGTDGGGAETNSLEVITTGIASTEIPIGTAADTVVYAALSGDATMSNAGVVTVVDDLHAHTSSSISGLDISADTNLAVTAPIVLTDDTVSVSTNSSSSAGVVSSGSGQLNLVWKTDGSGNPGWRADADSGGSTAWNSIGDASADGAVAFGDTSQDLDANTNNVTAIAQDVLAISMTNDAATDIISQRILVLENKASTNGVENGLVIDNQDADDVMTKGIEIVSAAGGITTGIDASDADIGTALAIGANSVSATDGALIDLSAINMSSSTEGLVIGQATSCSSATGSGQVCADTDATGELLHVGMNSEAKRVGWFQIGATWTGTSSTRYVAISSTEPNATATNVDVYKAPYDMVCKEMTATVNTAPGVGTSWTVAFNINGSAATKTLSIEDATTDDTDDSDSIAITKGHVVYIEQVRVSTAASPGLSTAYLWCRAD